MIMTLFRRRQEEEKRLVVLIMIIIVAPALTKGSSSDSSSEEKTKEEVVIHIVSDECQCDDVLRPMFWHDFLPSYLACQADLVCLLTRMRWMTAKGEINASGAISTFRKANPSWLVDYPII
jgi:hypothetical protein